MLVHDRARKSVGFIGRWEGDRDNGRFIANGTAFHVTCVTAGHRFTHMVTAQHVIVDIQKHTNRIVFRFNTKSGEYAVGAFPAKDWYFHPDATRYVDVAVVPCNMPPEADLEHVALDLESATESVIQEKGIGPGEELFIAGYFRYHSGTTKNIPIIRVGNIAAMPDEPINTKSGPINGYLIEARSIGGLSGSPVFVNMAPHRIVDLSVTRTEGSPYYLLGLMHGHYDVKAGTDAADIKEAVRMNTGIGIVVPVQDILETVMQPELEDQRQKLVDDMKESGINVTEDVAGDTSDDKRDVVLKTMLNTPPDPHSKKPAK